MGRLAQEASKKTPTRLPGTAPANSRNRLARSTLRTAPGTSSMLRATSRQDSTGTMNFRGKSRASRGMLSNAPPNPEKDRKKKANRMMA